MAPTCSAQEGGSRAAPRPAVRAQRRRRARDIVQGAASGQAQCRCTNNQGQRGAAAAPEGRTWPTTAPAPGCPRMLSCCSTPRCSCPAAPPCAEQSPGSCSKCFLVPLHQEPGSERSSSRTRGTHLASDGPNLQHPRGSRAAPRPAVRAQLIISAAALGVAILERFWTALRLRRSRGLRGARNLTKRVALSKMCSVGG